MGPESMAHFEDDDDDSRGEMNTFAWKPLGRRCDLYLDGKVQHPGKYNHWWEIIRGAGEDDLIYVHINSYGGDLFTAVQFMRVAAESKATLIASVEGACFSAATLFLLAADSYEISRHSSFLFHNYSSGTVGKGQEMYDKITHEKKWTERLFREMYAAFLTTEELDKMITGTDLWMDGEEVLERLKVRREIMEEMAMKFQKEAEQAALNEKVEAVQVATKSKTKPRAKRTTKKDP